MKKVLGVVSLISLISVPAFAEGDVIRGEKIAKKCLGCHTFYEGGKNKSGPNLFNIVERPAGSIDNFRYSTSLKNANFTWNEENLDVFLKNPRGFVKGTKMSFPGLRKEKDRLNLVAFLKTLTRSSKHDQ